MTAAPEPSTDRIPPWITDQNVIESILAGHIEIPDDLNPEKEVQA